MRRLTCRAVLFDVDGVLVDSRAIVERTWLRWAALRGIDRTDLAAVAHGRRTIDTVRDVAPHLDPIAEVEWLEGAERDDVDGLIALPGAHEALSAVPDARRALVTSGGRALATVRMNAAGLPFPTTLVSAEQVKNGKPAPDGYLLGAERLGFAPTECVVFEDTPPGIGAGCAAGATVIALSTTFPKTELGLAHAVVGTLADVRISVEGEVLRIAW